jgi:hypothetical protein
MILTHRHISISTPPHTEPLPTRLTHGTDRRVSGSTALTNAIEETSSLLSTIITRGSKFLILAVVSFQHTPPFFGHNERSVYVALREVYLPALLEVFGQSFEHFAQNPLLDPLLKATVRGLVGRVAFGKVLPGRPGAQYPEDAVQDIAWVSPGPASSVFSSRWLWDKKLQYFPLLVCEVHAALLLLLEGHMTAPLYPWLPHL